ncbi:TPA: hypothetical protein SLO92_002674 [Klebsiella pneumoniae]|uniref:hypothetical protein n=1 Tax=Klebsiella pneumoniae complex TaxID=3390273 RepID=UPI00065073B3|nr:hypothetical protein [Klebsiella pneumoniae]HBQ5778681.1 hypothetical protein [Klebsiella pneumoniae subsp. pneumoniae]ELC0802403.1 hypothetical protein [Klebsiella pneumoniae]KME78986.1 hypothetical protein SM12_01619 [Klebsiella pneumoniae]MBD7816616.1 hypothetical protein [Klebsiella pneumoniae]MBD7871510.1 hypothetical protein [Klebsiella pneumoniae]
MDDLMSFIMPDSNRFKADPLGYSSLAAQRFGIIGSILANTDIDITKPSTTEDLKNPILWMSQAEALSQAALLVLKANPSFDSMPEPIRGICDGQFRATGLMLIGYALEIALKSMIIIEKGINAYIVEEKNYQHHRLHDLATFIPDLTTKDRVILKLLTHFIYWAGRYPDPGTRKEDQAQEILLLSEKHKICLPDVMRLAKKIMSHAQVVINSVDND